MIDTKAKVSKVEKQKYHKLQLNKQKTRKMNSNTKTN